MSEDRFAALEHRVRALEDRLEIFQIVATYGPAVDSLSELPLESLWTEDGVYDAGGSAPYVGRAEIGTLLGSELHRKFVAAGCAHVGSLPQVTVNGDSAVAVNYTRVYVHDGDQWKVARASANRWELVRTGQGWQVKHRLNRPIDGTPQPREIIGSELR